MNNIDDHIHEILHVLHLFLLILIYIKNNNVVILLAAQSQPQLLIHKQLFLKIQSRAMEHNDVSSDCKLRKEKFPMVQSGDTLKSCRA